MYRIVLRVGKGFQKFSFTKNMSLPVLQNLMSGRRFNEGLPCSEPHRIFQTDENVKTVILENDYTSIRKIEGELDISGESVRLVLLDISELRHVLVPSALKT